MDVNQLKERVIQSVSSKREEILRGIQKALMKEHPKNTKILIFDQELRGTSLLVYAYSAESISYPYPDPLLVTRIDLLQQANLPHESVREELIQWGQRVFIQLFTECFIEAGAKNYPLPCFLCDGALDYYYLQENRWLDITEVY